MRALVQRAASARVLVDGAVVGELARPGLLVLLGVTHDDGDAEVAWVADKVAGLRVLRDPAATAATGAAGGPAGGAGAGAGSGAGGGRAAPPAVVGAVDAGAPVLVVSQFTLYGDVRKGRRPSWTAAAPGPVAEPLVDAVVEALRARGLEVSTGVFGADMLVESVNDGPLTLWLDSAQDRGR